VVEGAAHLRWRRKARFEVMGNIGMQELLIILFIIVLLFGAKRIPEIMRGMGRGVKEFKEGMKDEEQRPPRGPDKPDEESKPAAR
jgi:sec-independent protein translocase protein TatA